MPCAIEYMLQNLECHVLLSSESVDMYIYIYIYKIAVSSYIWQ